MLDVVAVTRDIPEKGLAKGTRGTIVEVSGCPTKFVELETVDIPECVELSVDDLQLIEEYERPIPNEGQ